MAGAVLSTVATVVGVIGAVETVGLGVGVSVVSSPAMFAVIGAAGVLGAGALPLDDMTRPATAPDTTAALTAPPTFRAVPFISSPLCVCLRCTDHRTKLARTEVSARNVTLTAENRAP